MEHQWNQEQAQALWYHSLHMTISHCKVTLSFHCLAVYKHTKNLGSVNANCRSSVLVSLILVMMLKMV